MDISILKSGLVKLNDFIYFDENQYFRKNVAIMKHYSCKHSF